MPRLGLKPPGQEHARMLEAPYLIAQADFHVFSAELELGASSIMGQGQAPDGARISL